MSDVLGHVAAAVRVAIVGGLRSYEEILDKLPTRVRHELGHDDAALATREDAD